MSKISQAVSWAVSIAEDNTHGYSQGSRWGPDYDCSSLLIQAWENAGVKVKSAGAVNTTNMCSIFLANGFKDVTNLITLSNGTGLKTGDVLWVKGHTEMMCSDTKIVGAHISETGGVTGEQGDQTGREISVQNYYNKPWTRVLRYTGDTVSKADVISSNAYLSESQMQKNASYIYQYLSAQGWTLNAVAGMLGNMERESTINPGIWQNLNSGNLSGGFGLVQWTPASTLIEWANSQGLSPSDIDTQLKRILYELENGLQYYPTDSYNLSFKQFTQSTKSPSYLASAFLHNYERAGVSAEAERQENAEKWYDFLIDVDPSIPSDTPNTKPKKKHLSLMMMYLATRK